MQSSFVFVFTAPLFTPRVVYTVSPMVPSLYWRTRLFGERAGWYVFIIISRKRLKREKVCCMFLKTSALRVSMDLSNIIRALVDVEHLVSAAKEVTTKRETGHTHTRRHLLHQTFSFAIEPKKKHESRFELKSRASPFPSDWQPCQRHTRDSTVS